MCVRASVCICVLINMSWPEFTEKIQLKKSKSQSSLTLQSLGQRLLTNLVMMRAVPPRLIPPAVSSRTTRPLSTAALMTRMSLTWKMARKCGSVGFVTEHLTASKS